MRSARRPQSTIFTRQAHGGAKSNGAVPESTFRPCDVHGLAAESLLGLGRSLIERYAAGELTGADIPLILAVTREEEARLSVPMGGAA